MCYVSCMEEHTMSSNPIKKVTVNLPSNQVEFLQKIAQDEHLTFTDVLRRSIKSEEFFVQQERSGNKILIESPDNKIRQILRK